MFILIASETALYDVWVVCLWCMVIEENSTKPVNVGIWLILPSQRSIDFVLRLDEQHW